MKKPLSFHLTMVRTRLRAVWTALTSQYFVLMACDDKGTIECQYNVNYAGFKMMTEEIEPFMVEDSEEATLDEVLEGTGVSLLTDNKPA